MRRDALIAKWGEAEAIIGNPPFLGGKKLRQELGDKYVKKIQQRFPDVQGQPDFCVFWFRKAHDSLSENGRAGLVGTNSIAQVSGRKASLDYVVNNGGIIHNAVSTQEWSGEAAVHVSIVNWAKQPQKQNFLDGEPVPFIYSSLKTEVPVDGAERLSENKSISFESCALGGKGFVISQEQAEEWIKIDPKNGNVLKPMLDGKGLINPNSKLNWVIDFNDMSLEEASNYKLPFQRVREQVKPQKDVNRSKLSQTYWWRFRRYSPAMREALKGLTCYFAVPKISKWAIFTPVDIAILPCEANMVIASDDFYILGILTSKVHRLWIKAQSSTLKGDTRYTNTTCFETFPFPQNRTSPLVAKIRATMQELHQYRTEQMEEKQWGITTLYNKFFHEPASQLYKFHAKLDKLVMQIYGFSDSDDLLEKLLHLNQEIANPSYMPTYEPLTDEQKDRVLDETRRSLQDMGIIPED